MNSYTILELFNYNELMKAFLGGAKKYIVQNSVFIIFLILIAVLSFVKFAKIDGDSGYFGAVELDKLADFTVMRYQTWTSRNIIEAILVISCHFPMLFALANVFFCGVLYKSVYGVAKKKDSRQLEFIVATSILASLIPAALNSAGYIPTIVNYLWPVSALTYVIYILKQLATRQKLLPRQYVFTVLAAIFGANSEQCAALLFGAVIVILGYLIYLRKKKDFKLPKFIFVLFTISIASLIHIATCPGNAQRIIVETTVHFPGFASLGFFDKVLLGFSDVITDMFAAAHPFYVAGLLILGIAVLGSKNNLKKVWNRILISLPSFILAGALLFEYYYHKATGDFMLTRIPYFAEHGDTLRYKLAMLLFVVVLVAYLIYCFYILCKKKLLFIATLGIFLIAGVLSKIIIGFSPSIFYSEFRTTTPLYISLVFIFCLLFSKRQQSITTREACLTYSLIGLATVINTVLLFS